jgi:hypothetical protein
VNKKDQDSLKSTKRVLLLSGMMGLVSPAIARADVTEKAVLNCYSQPAADYIEYIVIDSDGSLRLSEEKVNHRNGEKPIESQFQVDVEKSTDQRLVFLEKNQNDLALLVPVTKKTQDVNVIWERKSTAQQMTFVCEVAQGSLR